VDVNGVPHAVPAVKEPMPWGNQIAEQDSKAEKYRREQVRRQEQLQSASTTPA
jgi:hypothetical protein